MILLTDCEILSICIISETVLRLETQSSVLEEGTPGTLSASCSHTINCAVFNAGRGRGVAGARYGTPHIAL